jgi:hypothetical protein
MVRWETAGRQTVVSHPPPGPSTQTTQTRSLWPFTYPGRRSAGRLGNCTHTHTGGRACVHSIGSGPYASAGNVCGDGSCSSARAAYCAWSCSLYLLFVPTRQVSPSPGRGDESMRGLRPQLRSAS